MRRDHVPITEEERFVAHAVHTGLSREAAGQAWVEHKERVARAAAAANRRRANGRRAIPKTAKVKYVVRDLPLESIHPHALKAAEATHCAGEQGKYWEMHDRLFANQKEIARPDPSKHAQALGVDVAAFDQCLDSGKQSARVRKDMTEAQRLQATGTPTFFLGLTDPKSSQIKGTRLVGAQPYAAFKEAIDRLLASK